MEGKELKIVKEINYTETRYYVYCGGKCVASKATLSEAEQVFNDIESGKLTPSEEIIKSITLPNTK